MIPLCANMLYFIHLWALASTHQSSVDLSSRLSEMASCIRIQGHTYRKSIQILSCLLITSSKPGDALMCKYTRPSLAQMMDLHLWRHYPNQNWIITYKSISIIPQCTRQNSIMQHFVTEMCTYLGTYFRTNIHLKRASGNGGHFAYGQYTSRRSWSNRELSWTANSSWECHCGKSKSKSKKILFIVGTL